MRATYLSGNQNVQALIGQTVERLPRGVQEFVTSSVVFFAVGASQGHGQTMPMESMKTSGFNAKAEWVVVLCEDGLLPASDESMAIIAHEIAHAVLGPDAAHGAVAQQTADWGFTGPSTVPNNFP